VPELLRAAERELSPERNVRAIATADVRGILGLVEAATRGGASLHAQLDTVRK
jgi:hypothetical protein